MHERQRTIEKSVSYTGQGLHTGETATIRLSPASPNTGVVFLRRDLPERPRIRVAPESAHYDPDAGRRTILKRGGVEIHSMEHLLSAVSGMRIDNVEIEVDGLEIPESEDGSALSFTRLLQGAGIVEQNANRHHIRIHRPIELRDGDAVLTAAPAPGLEISFAIDFPDSVVGRQQLSVSLKDGTYEREIAPARTFVFEHEVRPLQEAGLIKGGSMDKAIVVGEDSILNDGALRFPDEFVRHKILDLVGDLALLGAPVRGKITSRRSGHATNVAFVQKLAREVPRGGKMPGTSLGEWDITSIMEVMPHRYPFLLLDRIVELEEGKRIVGIKNVTINEEFFNGHFPGHPVMPAVLILEAMAQCGGVLLRASVENPGDKLMYFVGIDNAKFRRPVRPGDQLRLELELLKFKGRICKMRGKAFVDDQLVAEAELMSSSVDR